jgi:hypothetical protein
MSGKLDKIYANEERSHTLRPLRKTFAPFALKKHLNAKTAKSEDAKSAKS